MFLDQIGGDMTKCRARIQRWRRRLGVRARNTRGAVLVEFAVIVPILLVPLLVGVLEYGFLWNKVHTLESASRAGARVGATGCLHDAGVADGCDNGNKETDDMNILAAVNAALGNLRTDVLYIVVYRADSAGGAPTPTCAAGAPSSSTGIGWCNVYNPTDMAAAAAGNSSSFTCTTKSQYWCPTSRRRGQIGQDYLGVYIASNHNYVTSFWGSSRSVSDTAVFAWSPTRSA